MKRVVIESPFMGDEEENLLYLRACMRDSLMRNEAPFASHGLYTQPGVLNDREKHERDIGISAGFMWRDVADATVVYTDLGISPGMELGIMDANDRGRPIEYRTLGLNWQMIAKATARLHSGKGW